MAHRMIASSGWRLSGRVLILSLTLLCALASAILSADASEHEEGAGPAIERIISAQLDAFADDDDERAFSYASPAIQNGFSSASAFAKMVKQRYPAVFQAVTVRFREHVPHPGFLVQRVQLVGPRGHYWDAYYRMEPQGSGEWRIGGVVLTEVAGGI
ncbi:DUF4864 domain-containing protein [Marinobacter sp. 1Y8]